MILKIETGIKMNIVVCLKRVLGKDLFYPVSDDAHFITNFTGKTTVLEHQLKLCQDRGWRVNIIYNAIDFEDYMPKTGRIYE